MGCNCRNSVSRQTDRLVDMMRSSFSQQVTAAATSKSANKKGSVICPKCGRYKSPVTNSLVRCPTPGCNTVFAATTANAR